MHRTSPISLAARPTFWLSLVALLLIAIAPALAPAYAQTGGQGGLQGTVTDSTGAVITNAKVVATSQNSGVNSTRTTSSAGLYSIAPLIPDKYTITVSAPGFKTISQQNIEVVGLSVTGYNAKLDIGSTDQTVTVTEAPPQLDTTNATLGGVITNEIYESLPLILNNQQRDPTAFATLAPGAQGGARAPIISGTGNYLAEVYLDGIPTTTANQQGDNRIISNAIPVESVDQLRVITSSPSAEYQGAGAIAFTTKSGGNKYHGTFLDLVRNTVFDTWGFGGNQVTSNQLINGVATVVPTGKPVEHQNEFSLSAGGPIPFTRHKGFIFANYDQFHGRNGVTPAQFFVPTARMKAGDFSQLLTTVNGVPSGMIYDPTTNAICAAHNTGGLPCRYQYGYGPGNGIGANGNPVLIGTANVIPAGQISPISKFEQSFLPDPQSDIVGLNTQYGGVSGFDNHETVVKGDYDVARLTQRFSFFYTHGVRQSAGYGAVLPVPYANAASSIISPTVMIFEHSILITPHIVNQFKYGFSRFPQPVLAPTDGLAQYSATAAGITGLPAGQASGNFPGASFTTNSNIFNTTIGPFTQNGAANSSHNVVPNAYTLVDNLEISKGKHSLTFGIQTQWLQDNVTSQSSPSGIYTQNFSPVSTANFVGQTLNSTNNGYSYASFLLGAVNTAGTSVPLFTETAGRYHPISPYVQDDWKITPNFTLNLGLRYDFLPPYREAQDRFSFFNATGINPITGTAGLLQYAGNRGSDISCNCRTPVSPYYKNFGPRIGFAWSVDQNTVFRGGFAVAYSRAGGVGGRAGDSTGSGQSGFGSSIILPAANNTGVNAGPSYYLNNGPTFTTLGLANTNFGGPGYVIPAPTGPSAASLTLGTGNYVNSAGTYVTPGGAPGYLDPYLAARGPQFIFYNFGMQKAVFKNTTFNVNYSGSQSHFVAGAGVPGFWSGQLDPSYLVTLGSVVGSDKTTNILNSLATPANFAIAQAADPRVKAPYSGFVATNATANATISRLLRPFPQYSGTPSPTFDNISNISYNSFQLTLAQREVHGVSFTVNYTFSRNIGDDGTTRSAFAVPAAVSSNGMDIAGNNRADRDLVATDTPENFNIFGLAKSPFGKGHIGGDNFFIRTLAGGWSLSGIFSYNSGTPLLITASGCNTPNSGTCMPDLVPGRLNSIRQNGGYGHNMRTFQGYKNVQYLDPTAFSLPRPIPNSGAIPLTTIGDSPRSSLNLWSPSRNNVDLSLKREFHLTSERFKVQFQADCFDITNRVTFGIAQSQVFSATANTAASSFGKLNTYGGNRRFQFAGRLNF